VEVVTGSLCVEDDGIQVFKEITHTVLLTLEEPVSGGSVSDCCLVCHSVSHRIRCMACWCSIKCSSHESIDELLSNGAMCMASYL